MSSTGKDGTSKGGTPGPKAEDATETSAPVAGGGTVPGTEKSGDTVPETGGRDGPDPTRFGDWEKNGRCVDF